MVSRGGNCEGEWGCVRVGGTVWNTLKEGGKEKKGGETNVLKRVLYWPQNCGNMPLLSFPLNVFWYNIYHNIFKSNSFETCHG